MLILLNVVSLILLLSLAFQDFRERKISIVLLVLLLLVYVTKANVLLPYKDVIRFTSFNLGFVFLQLIFIAVYFYLRKGQNFWNKGLGAGDVLFFVLLTVAFSPVNFVLFYVLSLIVTLLVYLCSYFLKKTKFISHHIPLAGSVAVQMAVLLLVQLFYPAINFFDDTFLTSFFDYV